jgi:hypothetical protein
MSFHYAHKQKCCHMYVLKSSFQFVDYVLPLEYENIHIANVNNKVLGMTLGSQPKKNCKLSLV